MKFLKVLIPAIFLLTFLGCEDDSPEPAGEFSCEVISQSDCITGQTIMPANYASNETAVEYNYDRENGVLEFTHFNAGFNCCPGEIFTIAKMEGDTIFIEEYESEALCDCNCLYNIDFKAEGIDEKSYTIKFSEPYVYYEGDEITFTVDLKNKPSGKFSKPRYGYPWAEISDEVNFSCDVVRQSECLSNTLLPKRVMNLENTETAVSYDYDVNTGILKLTHMNAGFNCCPGDIFTLSKLRNDTIFIEEYESEAACRCNCLYDIDMMAQGVPVDKYIVAFSEPYAQPGDEVEFSVDLKNNPTGKHSQKRSGYPWGE
jgi:hypothetical protein